MFKRLWCKIFGHKWVYVEFTPKFGRFKYCSCCNKKEEWCKLNGTCSYSKRGLWCFCKHG